MSAQTKHNERVTDATEVPAKRPRLRKVEMLVDGERKWMEAWDAVCAYDSGFASVQFGAFVMEEGAQDPRAITDEDKSIISKAADEYSASK